MLFWRRGASPPSVESRSARSRNRQDRNRFAIGISGRMISSTKAIWIPLLLLLRILFARATTRAYPYFSSFHLAKEAILTVTSPVIRSRPNEVGARNASNLCRSTWLEPAARTAEIGPLAGHYWHVEWGSSEVSNQL